MFERSAHHFLTWKNLPLNYILARVLWCICVFLRNYVKILWIRWLMRILYYVCWVSPIAMLPLCSNQTAFHFFRNTRNWQSLICLRNCHRTYRWPPFGTYIFKYFLTSFIAVGSHGLSPLVWTRAWAMERSKFQATMQFTT